MMAAVEAAALTTAAMASGMGAAVSLGVNLLGAGAPPEAEPSHPTPDKEEKQNDLA
jgi:hypothetical protein